MEWLLKLQHVQSLSAWNSTLLHIMIDLTRTIREIHLNSVSHGDIKPENILLSFEGNRVVTVLIDWSSSSRSGAPLRSHPYGTTQYMAPEVVHELLHDPRRAEIFSLGVVLHSMLFGSFPQYTRSHRVTFHQLLRTHNRPVFEHGGMLQLLESMLSYTPMLRPTADEVLKTLLYYAPEFATKRNRCLDFTPYAKTDRHTHTNCTARALSM